MLIAFAGPPATGKTTIASALADALAATHASVDDVESAMLAAGVERAQPTGWPPTSSSSSSLVASCSVAGPSSSTP